MRTLVTGQAGFGSNATIKYCGALHVDDLYDLINLNLNKANVVTNGVWNTVGGANNAMSLTELIEARSIRSECSRANAEGCTRDAKAPAELEASR